MPFHTRNCRRKQTWLFQIKLGKKRSAERFLEQQANIMGELENETNSNSQLKIYEKGCYSAQRKKSENLFELAERHFANVCRNTQPIFDPNRL